MLNEYSFPIFDFMVEIVSLCVLREYMGEVHSFLC